MKSAKKIFAGFAVVGVLIPVVVSAQTTQTDLRNAIQASILSDPRSQSIPPAQMQALVDALTQQAQAQHMSASDILWQPKTAEAATLGSGPGATVCPSGWQGYACAFNQVFGFEGNNYEIPIFLLVTSLLLIAVLWEVHQHHKKALAAKAAGMVK